MPSDPSVAPVMCEFPELVDMIAITVKLGSSESHLYVGDDLGTSLKESPIPSRPIIPVGRTVVEPDRLANPAIVPSG